MAVAANATPEQAPYADAYSDAAIQSLMDSLDEKEDHLQSIPMPKEDYNAIHEPVTKLKDNIQEFSEQENIYGPEPETLCGTAGGCRSIDGCGGQGIP